MPGGCVIGQRPIDLHKKGLRALGATIETDFGKMTAHADELVGKDIYLDQVSVGATINIMLAAVKAKGNTTIVNAAKEPQPAQNPAQADAGHSSRPSRSRRRRGTRPAPGTPIEPAGKTASRPADTSHGQSPKQGAGNASKTAGNKSAAGAAPKSAANPDPGPSAKPSRRRKRGGSGNTARSAAAPAAKSAPAAAEAPQKKWWKRWL